MLQICISSCLDYSNSTIPNITKSLIDSGINPDNIWVVIGGCVSNQKTILESKIHQITTTHNSFDLTALIEVTENKMFDDNWLLLHDTCVAGPNFTTLLKSYEPLLSKSGRVALRSHPSMSIGLYEGSFLSNHLDVLQKYKSIVEPNNSESLIAAKHKAFQSEDCLLWKLPKVSSPSCMGSGGFQQQKVDNNLWNFSYTGRRVQEYFPQLDLYKLKANYGQRGTPICNL